MSLPPAFLDELRARTPLSTLIGTSVKLQRAGREWKACCPFHNEKSPSFYVNDDKGFYHCFGCGAHGDAIRWMTDQRGLPFLDAVKELAQAAGLDMPEPDRQSAEQTQRAKGLHEAMADAATWFVERMGGIEGADARAALQRRGIRPETAKSFGLGFSPDSRGKLKDALKQYGDALLVEAGLLIKVDDKEPYDRFRGRLMIPIRDPRGRVIAFGGRVIGEGEPKYLNSPETPLFDKGRTLYNLDRAQTAARKAHRIIAVEGYMDVIALAQAGFEEAVAPLGTALTEHQLERLWRIVDVPLLCFDGDAAGQKAAIRAAHRALPMLAPGRSLAFVTLPDGQDPDDLVRGRGAAAFEALLKRPEALVDRLWGHEVAAESLATPEARAGLRQRLNELAGTIVDPGVRSEYLAEFRRRFDALFASPPRAPFGERRRGPWKPPEPPVLAKTRGIGAVSINPTLAKGVLAGLIRQPREIAHNLDLLDDLRSVGGEFGELFEALMDLAIRGKALDTSSLLTILHTSGLDLIARQLLRADGFHLISKAATDDRMHADLREAIAVLVGMPIVEKALAHATAELGMQGTEEAFARQIALTHERNALVERLSSLLALNQPLADHDDLEE